MSRRKTRWHHCPSGPTIYGRSIRACVSAQSPPSGGVPCRSRVGCVAQLLAVILVRDAGEGIQTELVEVIQVSFALSSKVKRDIYRDVAYQRLAPLLALGLPLLFERLACGRHVTLRKAATACEAVNVLGGLRLSSIPVMRWQ